MIKEDIKKFLNSDIEFYYNGKGASFLPIGVYVVGFDNQGVEFQTLEEAIDAKVFDGQSLVDIWDIVLPQIS